MILQDLRIRTAIKAAIPAVILHHARQAQADTMTIVLPDKADIRAIVHRDPADTRDRAADIRVIVLSVRVSRTIVLRDKADIRATDLPVKADSLHRDLPRAVLADRALRVHLADIRVIVPRDKADSVQDLRKAADLPATVPVMILSAREQKMRILSDQKKITDMVHAVHQEPARAEPAVLQSLIRIFLLK